MLKFKFNETISWTCFLMNIFSNLPFDSPLCFYNSYFLKHNVSEQIFFDIWLVSFMRKKFWFRLENQSISAKIKYKKNHWNLYFCSCNKNLQQSKITSSRLHLKNSPLDATGIFPCPLTTSENQSISKFRQINLLQFALETLENLSFQVKFARMIHFTRNALQIKQPNFLNNTQIIDLWFWQNKFREKFPVSVFSANKALQKVDQLPANIYLF